MFLIDSSETIEGQNRQNLKCFVNFGLSKVAG